MHTFECCRFRQAVRSEAGAELARCGLLHEIAEVEDPEMCEVRRDACEACWALFPRSASQLNPVLASLLYKIGGAIVERGGVAGCDVPRATRLQDRARRNLSEYVGPPDHSSSCDVLVCCPDSSEQADRAVRSVLEQEGVPLIVHLVDDGGGGDGLVRRYGGRAGVVTHRNPSRRGTFATLHDLVPRLRSEYVAIQDPATVSRPGRFSSSLRIIESRGADLMGAAIQTPAGLVVPEPAGREYRRYVPPQTLVFRRACLVDMGGCAERGDQDADAELVYRAHREGRSLAIVRDPMTSTAVAWSFGGVGDPPRYEERNGSLRHHARGFAMSPVECDVVLPFCGHLEFLEESLPSVLEQDGAEAIVHLVDDGTPGGAEQVLRRWGTHPRVRTYRNVRNLGQFMSFNNIVPFLESRLVAVQDADDISLPHRLHWAGNTLHLADAGIFGGWTNYFRHTEPPSPRDEDPDGSAGRAQDSRHGASLWPRPGEHRYFLENPTAVMRVEEFERIGGFTDYGDADRNKCGVDTEFYVRAYHARTRFMISREVVLKYRRHPGSVTQNATTGFGTAPRYWTDLENQRRFRSFRRSPFDPRSFGGLANYRGLTQRIG
jgi:glycosyltransferase involved in cell wall biosynthesis